MEPCYLVLEDGSVFPGKSFGHPPIRAESLSIKKNNKLIHEKLPVGEVVFNTGMSGYHEIITDPSYNGQIIVMTYPHIGNYGTHEDWTEYGPGKGKKHTRLKASGLVIRSLYNGPIPEGRVSLHDFMESYKTTGITDVDTRRLTLNIRNGGSPRGIIVRASADEENKKANSLNKTDLNHCMDYLYNFPKMEGRDLVTELNSNETLFLNKGGSPHISIVDCGVKANIIQELISIGCEISLVNNQIKSEDLLSLNQQGILFSNGPGDPAALKNIILLAGDLIGKKPVFGICLGHQIISLALGAKTFKMKFGHHGINNPVRDEETGIVQVTSQNHGFAVDEASLPSNCKVRFRNVNDKTVEGIEDRKLHILTAQFHPEAAPGPLDSVWIFKSFLDLL